MVEEKKFPPQYNTNDDKNVFLIRMINLLIDLIKISNWISLKKPTIIAIFIFIEIQLASLM